MRKAVLYIAMSLDGYIADQNGGVDWLAGQDSAGERDDSYAQFAQTVDTVIMGWRTYHQIVTELSPGRWVYDGMQCYVITHHKEPSTQQIAFVSTDPCSLIQSLKHDAGKNIWICGGAMLAQQLMQKNLIDIYHISVIPTILGAGTRLFASMEQEMPLRLLQVKDSNGIVEVVYQKR